MSINSQIHQAKQAFILKLALLIKHECLYFLGIFTTLATLHLNIVWRHPDESAEFTFYALYWAGILFLLWQNRRNTNTTSWFSNLLGLGLLFIVIFRPFHLWQLDLILFRSGSIIAALGIGLISFGFSGLRYHWRPFLLLCLMLLPYGIINNIFAFRLHFSELTATTSAFALHYLGFKATYQGTLVKLPTGQVEVLYYCTGGLLIVWLLKLSLLIMVVVFPLTWRQRLGLVLCAFGTGFLVGCFRVALLAVVVNNRSLFDYWHSYTGGSIFMGIATFTYAAISNWILPLENLYSTKKDDIATVIVQPKRVLFLAATWIGVVLAAIYSIASTKLATASILPDKLSLHSWEQVKVTTINNQQKPETEINPRSKVVHSGKDYSYLKNNQQLQIQMRYVVNTRGDSNPFLKKLNENLVKDSYKNVKYIKGVGYYSLYSDAKQAYLTACINPHGGSTVNSNQFLQNRYTYDLTWSRILPWILGKEVLRDNRCIWAQLSVGLNGVADSEVYPILESSWTANYPGWQSLFQKN
jgi:cyanoexosortase A